MCSQPSNSIAAFAGGIVLGLCCVAVIAVLGQLIGAALPLTF